MTEIRLSARQQANDDASKKKVSQQRAAGKRRCGKEGRDPESMHATPRVWLAVAAFSGEADAPVPVVSTIRSHPSATAKQALKDAAPGGSISFSHLFLSYFVPSSFDPSCSGHAAPAHAFNRTESAPERC